MIQMPKQFKTQHLLFLFKPPYICARVVYRKSNGCQLATKHLLTISFQWLVWLWFLCAQTQYAQDTLNLRQAPMVLLLKHKLNSPVFMEKPKESGTECHFAWYNHRWGCHLDNVLHSKLVFIKLGSYSKCSPTWGKRLIDVCAYDGLPYTYISVYVLAWLHAHIYMLTHIHIYMLHTLTNGYHHYEEQMLIMFPPNLIIWWSQPFKLIFVFSILNTPKIEWTQCPLNVYEIIKNLMVLPSHNPSRL